MDKKLLRKKYVEKRNELSQQDIDDRSIAIANQLLSLPIWNATFMHLFLSIESKKEVDTSYILSVLQGKDKEVIVPKVSLKGDLEHFVLTDSTALKINRWGIPEPLSGIRIQEDQIDVVFVPLLAFDTQGHRIGYGKGMYDGFLQKCRTDVIKIGLSFFEAEPPFQELFPTDIPLNYCVTPKKSYSF